MDGRAASAGRSPPTPSRCRSSSGWASGRRTSDRRAPRPTTPSSSTPRTPCGPRRRAEAAARVARGQPLVDEREARAASILRLLTYLRVILVPIVMWLLLSDPFDHAYGVAAALFAFAAATA